MLITDLFTTAPNWLSTHMPFNWWKKKQTMVYPYSGILLNDKKECATDTYIDTDKFQMLYAERSQTQKAIKLWFHSW